MVEITNHTFCLINIIVFLPEQYSAHRYCSWLYCYNSAYNSLETEDSLKLFLAAYKLCPPSSGSLQLANYFIYPVKFGLGKQPHLWCKHVEANFWYLLLFGSDDLFKKFERLNAKLEMLYSWNENAYRKTKTAHL